MIKEVDAIHMLKRLEWYVQKARSDQMEAVGVIDETEDSASWRVLRDLQPWLFGENNIVIALHDLNTRIAQGEALTAADFYNMMYFVHVTPVLELSPTAFGEEWEFPKPTLKIFKEWEPKDE